MTLIPLFPFLLSVSLAPIAYSEMLMSMATVSGSDPYLYNFTTFFVLPLVLTRLSMRCTANSPLTWAPFQSFTSSLVQYFLSGMSLFWSAQFLRHVLPVTSVTLSTDAVSCIAFSSTVIVSGVSGMTLSDQTVLAMV